MRRDRDLDEAVSEGPPLGERRYTEEELALILNRAAERQEGVAASAARYSLADIQEIAAGAGIAPDHVASVAMSLRDRPASRGGGLLGAPWRFRVEDSLAGEVSNDVVAELLDLARRELGVHGEVVEALGVIEWKAQDALGWTHVTVARRGGRTSIGVISRRDDAVAVAGTVGGVGTFLGSIFLTTLLGQVAAVATPLAVVGGIGLATSVSWLSARAVWMRYARRSDDRVSALGAELMEAARRAASDGRTIGTETP
jgi:hypothetical protein